MDLLWIAIMALWLIGYFVLQPRITAKKSLNKPVGVETFLLWTMSVIAVLLLIVQVTLAFI